MGLNKLPQIRLSLALVVIALAGLIGYNFPRPYVAFGVTLAAVIVTSVYVLFERDYIRSMPFIVRLYNYVTPLKFLCLEIFTGGDFFKYDGYETLPSAISFITKTAFVVNLSFPFILASSQVGLPLLLYASYVALVGSFSLVMPASILQPIVFLVSGLIFYLNVNVRKYVAPSNVVVSLIVPLVYYCTVAVMYYADSAAFATLLLIPVIFALIIAMIISYYDDL